MFYLMNYFVCVASLVLLLSAVVYGQDKLIMGGDDTDITRVPYQLALLWNATMEPYCGAAILGEYTAITAGHCVEGKSPDEILIKAGTSDLRKGGSLHRVLQMRIHEKYQYLHYDVAVLRVRNPFVFSKEVQKIFLADEEPKAGELALVSGWGLLSSSGSSPRSLQSVWISIAERKVCEDIYGPSVVISDVICAGDSEGNRSSCDGDSGGPLAIQRKLVGIVSFRSIRGCGKAGYPSGFANVARAKDWLLEQLQESKFRSR